MNSRHIMNMSRHQNIVVLGKPGAAKTLTAEAIATAFPLNKRVAIVTSTQTLKQRMIKRLDHFCYIDILTSSDLAAQLFGQAMDSDYKILKIKKKLEAGNVNYWPIVNNPYEVIIVDDVHYCTELRFWLLSLFLQANQQALGKSTRLILFGADNQDTCSAQADIRYASLAPKILTDIDEKQKWSTYTLNTSFRFPHRTARFINKVVLGDKRLTGIYDGPPPIIIKADFSDMRSVVTELQLLIEKYKEENTVILVPVIQNQYQIAGLFNTLLSKGIKMVVPRTDSELLDEQAINGNLVFATVDQFRGLERDLVIILWMKEHPLLRHDLKGWMANAMTRTCKQLVVIRDLGPKIEPKDDNTTGCTDEADNYRLRCLIPIAKATEHSSNMTVQNFLANLNKLEVNRLVSQHLELHPTSHKLSDQEKPHKAPLPKKSSPSPPSPDDIPTIIRLVVLTATEHNLFGTTKTLDSQTGKLQRKTKARPFHDPFTPRDLMRLCLRTGKYLYRRYLFKGYLSVRSDALQGIMTSEDLQTYVDRLMDALMVDEKILVSLFFKPDLWTREVRHGNYRLTFHGSADIIAIHRQAYKITEPVLGTLGTPLHPTFDEFDRRLWSVKFADSLCPEHALEAAVSAWLVAQSTGKEPHDITLFNIATGEKWSVKSRGNLSKLMDDVFETLLPLRPKVSDKAFLERYQEIRESAIKIANVSWEMSEDSM